MKTFKQSIDPLLYLIKFYTPVTNIKLTLNFDLLHKSLGSRIMVNHLSFYKYHKIEAERMSSNISFKSF